MTAADQLRKHELWYGFVHIVVTYENPRILAYSAMEPHYMKLKSKCKSWKMIYWLWNRRRHHFQFLACLNVWQKNVFVIVKIVLLIFQNYWLPVVSSFHSLIARVRSNDYCQYWCWWLKCNLSLFNHPSLKTWYTVWGDSSGRFSCHLKCEMCTRDSSTARTTTVYIAVIVIEWIGGTKGNSAWWKKGSVDT
jgi:hypothetical protein